MPDTWDPNISKVVASAQAKHRQTQIEAGLLGKFFGSRENAPTNIAGIVAVLLLLFAMLYSIWPSQQQGSLSVKDMWAMLMPIITTIVGYVIGKKTSGA